MEKILNVTAGKKDITNLCGTLSFSTDDDTNGEELSFDAIIKLNVGDVITVTDAGVRFMGTIVDEDEPTRPPFTYRAVDFSRNLKGDIVIQFKKMRIDAAIRQIFSKFGIACDICDIPATVSKIYKSTIVDTIKDLLRMAKDDQGRAYYLEVRGKRVVVEEKKKRKIYPEFIMADDTSIARSAEDLRNQIVVVSSEEGSAKVLATVKDAQSIQKFGLLQQNEEIDSKKGWKERAETRLKEVNKITTTVSVTLLVTKGYWDIRKNRLIQLQGSRLRGWYRIRSSEHTIEDGVHRCTVELEW